MAEAFRPLVLVELMVASLVQEHNGSRVVQQPSEVRKVTLHAVRVLEEEGRNQQVVVERSC